MIVVNNKNLALPNLMSISITSIQEQSLYEKEGLKVKKIHYTDNQDCIGMIVIRKSWLILMKVYQ